MGSFGRLSWLANVMPGFDSDEDRAAGTGRGGTVDIRVSLRDLGADDSFARGKDLMAVEGSIGEDRESTEGAMVVESVLSQQKKPNKDSGTRWV